MTDDPLPPEAEELPPAARHIYEHLSRPEFGPKTKSDLVSSLYYSEPTVRRSLHRLCDADLVQTAFHPTDGRRTLYRVPADEE